jgi:hypothetical protein
MDADAPVLRLLPLHATTRGSILEQHVIRGEGLIGNAAEQLLLKVPPGASAPLAYRIPKAPVLAELKFAAWLQCTEPGTRLAVQIELPRSPDPATGRPRVVLVRGEAIADGQRQQRLVIDGLPALLERHARALRVKYHDPIDPRGALATDLVILAPGGRSPVQLVVDQIEVYGVLGDPSAPSPAEAITLVAYPAEGSLPAPPAAASRVPAGDRGAAPASPPPLYLALQWQGESLAAVRNMGFNAVALPQLPDAKQVTEARRLGLRIVSPPPLASEPPTGLEERLDVIAAWDLGRVSEAVDVGVAFREQNRIRLLDPDRQRAVMLRPGTFPRETSRIADWLLLEPLSGSPRQTPGDVAQRLRQQVQGARPGTICWTALDTHATARQTSQWGMVRGAPTLPGPVSYDTLLRTTGASATCRPRGFLFRSGTNLLQTDASSQQRRLALELINLRLGLLGPWLTSGKPLSHARSVQAGLSGLVLQAERAYLIVPIAWNLPLRESTASGSQAASFVLTGASESSEAYLLTAGGSTRLRTQRVTGGLRISAEAMPPEGLILVTEDGAAYAQVEHYLRQHAARAAELRIELSALGLADAQRSWALLPAELAQNPVAMEPLARAEVILREARQALLARDAQRAYDAAAEADARLARLCGQLAGEITGYASAGTYPVVADWPALGDLALIEAATQRPDAPFVQLAGGGFEDLGELLRAGWQRAEQPGSDLRAGIRLSPESPHSGPYCLELAAELSSPEAIWVGSLPPLWVTSPPISIPPGHLVEFRGVARNASPELGSGARLLISDSLGGAELGVVAGESSQWTPFRIVRAGGVGQRTQLTLLLTELGKVQVDSLEYRLIPLAPPPRGLGGPVAPASGAALELGGVPQRLEAPRAIGR